MLKKIFLLSFSLSALAAAQDEVRPVLRALPLGGDDDIASRPLTAPVPSPAPTEEAVFAETAAFEPLESAAPAAPFDGKPAGDDAVRLQIFLDEAFFGPGVIDGKPGRFTEQAVRAWNEVNGYPPDSWEAVNAAARSGVSNPFAVAVVPDVVGEWVDSGLPTSRALQAKRKRMSYRSNAEFMAERYHCDVPYLTELNGSSKIRNLKPRDSIIVPNVTPFHIEKVTGAEYKKAEEGSEEAILSERHAVVDTKNNQVRIFEAAPAALVVAEAGAELGTTPVTRPNRALIASFPITPGQPKFIEFGTWELRNMVEMPWWRYDQQFLDTGTRSDNALQIPPGPNSPVGIVWHGTSRSGIGLHGTSDPETIGRARSAGCIRLANWDAIRLPALLRPGATIEIR